MFTVFKRLKGIGRGEIYVSFMLGLYFTGSQWVQPTFPSMATQFSRKKLIYVVWMMGFFFLIKINYSCIVFLVLWVYNLDEQTFPFIEYLCVLEKVLCSFRSNKASFGSKNWTSVENLLQKYRKICLKLKACYFQGLTWNRK